jgi:hypothetical protein
MVETMDPCENTFLNGGAKLYDGNHGGTQTTLSLLELQNKAMMQSGGAMDDQVNCKNMYNEREEKNFK